MASINTIVKRKQYLWLGIVVACPEHSEYTRRGAASSLHLGDTSGRTCPGG